MPLVKSTAVETVTEDARQSGRDCASLIQGLTAEDPKARRWAARDLLECPDAAEALMAHLPNETDVSVREVMLSTLIHLGDPAAVAGLVDCLRSQDASLRNQAIEALQRLPDAVAPIIAGLLNDPDPDVRIFTVNILESLRHPQVEQWLIDVIDQDPHVNVCGTAVDLLGEVGTAAARASLLRLKLRFADQKYIQFAANLALKRIDAD